MLLHFADAVRNIGPLYVHSAFPFEGMNGWLGDLYHGTKLPQNQVYICNIHEQEHIYIDQHMLLDSESNFEAPEDECIG